VMTSATTRRLLVLVGVAVAAGFAPAAHAPLVPGAYAARGRAAAMPSMKEWSRRKTLAEDAGGLADVKDAAAVGLVGTIPVAFEQGNETIETMAIAGQPLSEVATQCGQYIKYKCGKGECGTCEVRVDGKWIRTCTARVPALPPGEVYNIFVRASMTKTKKASRFFSFRSFIAGFRNNLLGMFGFVREGRKSQNRFQERLDNEQRILEIAAAKKAARLAAKQKQ